jgi:peptidoglycan/LPS O-acetylase OafA/YrhL
VIPFLLWSVLVFVLFLRRLPANLEEILFWYYYIPLVIQFYILSPFIIPFAKKNWKGFLALAILIELGRFTIKYFARVGLDFPGLDFLMMITPRWLFPNLFSYFAIGLVASFHREKLMSWLPRYKWHLLGLTIALAILTMVEYEAVARAIGQEWLGSFFGGYSRQFYALSFVFCFLAFDNVAIPFSKQISSLGGKSLGVYLVHSRLMYLAAVFLYDWTPQVLGNQYLYLAILSVFAVGGSLLLMELVKITPARKYYRYIFG